MRVAILDYQAGNLASVQRAVAHLGFNAEVTADPRRIASADRVIFPGVGAAGQCMANLRERGLDQALHQVADSGKPLLCVCIGMQLLFDFSDEDGGVDCLGILPGVVERFVPEPQIKVPHMGWNAVETADSKIFSGIANNQHFYFVHSYYCAPGPEVQVIAIADHGGKFCAGVRRDNLVAVQFHPEKSGENGLTLLRNFLND
jgi:glutamine amidotransferase